MAKFQNRFSKGTVNKDADERFVSPEELIDAENYFVNVTDGSSMGVGKNALGNALKTDYAIVGGKNHGTGVDNTNNFIYHFIKGDLYDYLIEYNTETEISEIVLQSTTGTRLNLKEGERVLNVDVIFSDKPYDSIKKEGGNLLKFSGDSNPPRIININRSKTFGIDGFTADEIMLIKAPPLYPPTVVQVKTVSDLENFIKEEFISFATRFRYKDNYYSAISPWQEYSFTPDRFQLDFSTCENNGMINIYNACDIKFNTGPREVTGVDLLFKKSNSSTVYKVEQFIKEEESWADGIEIPTSIRFSNSKVYSVLPDDQYFRSDDNVPENETASTFSGNRLMSANYREGKNLIDINGEPVIVDFTTDYVSLSPQSETLPITKLSTNSIFDASPIADGKIRIDFSGTNLVKDGAISILFNIKSIAVSPPLDPARSIFTFTRSYAVVLDKDYTDITDVITNDATNGFKSGIEGYLSELFLASLVYPEDSLDFPPSLFNGFSVSIVSGNVIDIVLPSMKYEIEVLPSGPNTFVTEYMQDLLTTAYVESIASRRSMKSYRSYEVVVVYKDAQGRKTTGLSSKNNTVFIPLSQSTSKNTITVDTGVTKPPAWATTYQFAIRENIKSYQEIYTTDFYLDGYFRWVRLIGTSKNKVAEGDYLLVKRDSNSVHSKPVKVKVLEIKTQDADFVDGGVVEQSGLYMKIKPEGFDMPYDPDSYREYSAYGSTRSGYPTVALTIPPSVGTGTIPEGSVLTFSFKSNFSNEDEFNNYTDKPFVASSEYPDIQTFFNVQLSTVVFQGDNTSVDFGGVFEVLSPSSNVLTVRGTSNGKNTVINPKSGMLDVTISLRTTAGFLIFENAEEEVDNGIFNLTPDIFNVVDGNHQFTTHLLAKTFNCYVQGNGAESYQVRDTFNGKSLAIDFPATGVSVDGYKQVDRYADITYSGVYNSSSNVNKLNEFNLSTGNFKDDIDKSYGPIYKIKGLETNLQVFQEDKDSQVFYGKDFLYNADGSTNLSTTDNVLGAQDLYIGEYGISENPESFDIYAGTVYHSDIKRGVVLKKVNNGLFEISSQKMKSYFKKLFRDNTINRIIGKYDQYHDVYILNVKYNDTEYVTWVYSDANDGWLGRTTFNPEDMCRVNNKFFSFLGGEIYEHNQPIRNTFYGIEYPSKFTFAFSQNPSERKVYKNIEIEGTDAWKINVLTDYDNGYVNESDFVKQEGVFRAYTRTSNEVIDNSRLSVQGIGNCTVNGLVLSFGYNLESEISVGDSVLNITNQLVGKIQSKTAKTLTLDTVENIVSGDFVMCSKTQSAESSGLLGYYMQVSAELTKTTKTEVYSMNSEVAKSYS